MIQSDLCINREVNYCCDTCASRVHAGATPRYQVVDAFIQGAVFYLINLLLDGVDGCREFNNFLLLATQNS